MSEEITANKGPAAPGLESALRQRQSRSDRAAIFIAETFGSVRFLITCILFLIGWAIWNLGLIPALKPFDPYPFPALEMFVSIFAIILSVSVLISQNRQGRMEKLRQQVEFEVNVHAESEITKVLTMLHEIQKKLGINATDKELERMKEDLDIRGLHRRLDQEDQKDNH